MQRFRPPTAGDEAAQAGCVAKLYAVALHEGAAAAFYFVLPHYIERNMDHGLLRADLTARLAYAALAAVGRLLADAHPLGKLRTDHPRLRGFIFRAQPDGKEHVVVVAWATDRAETLELPATPIATYDVLGRPLPSDTIELSTAPVIMVLAPMRPSFEWSRRPPPRNGSKASRRRSFCRSSSRSGGSYGRSRPTQLRPASLTAFRSTSTILGWERSKGRLTVKGPKDLNLRRPQSVQAASGDRIGVGVTLDVPRAATGVQTITIEGDFGFGRHGRRVVPTFTGGALMTLSKSLSVLALWSAIAVASVASAADRGLPKPLAGHPGNVFWPAKKSPLICRQPAARAFGAWLTTTARLWRKAVARARSVSAACPLDSMTFDAMRTRLARRRRRLACWPP